MFETILLSSFRALIAYLILLVVARTMGRKAISQMTFFDFVVAITIGSVAANLSIGNNATVLSAVAVLITFGTLAIFTGYMHIKSFRLRKLVNSEPLAVIENGKVNEYNLKRERFTLQELTALLREKNVFNIADVEFAILETDGKLSVLPKSQKQPVTPSDLNVPTLYKGMTKDLIVDGNIMYENLSDSKLDEAWLLAQLKNYNINNVKQVFYASLDTQGSLYVSRKKIDKEEHGKYGLE